MKKSKVAKPNIHTLGELKKSGYKSRSVKEEMRANLIKALETGEDSFPNILGYEDTVIPDLERAVLSRHNMLLLGLRGQAKTRIARQMIQLLDPYIPVVKGSEINDDPLDPISYYAIHLIEEKGDDTPIEWLAREERYVEKLATPDVNVADLIGDVDPIKAANLKLPYSDQRTIHFGLIPRSHRSIFVINELPDLQPRIQVSLFNMLQEGDLQIRGFVLRLPLDVHFIFTANPEDYTNRGSIVTPLKDRIESQILTHYPKSIEIAKEITKQEAKLHSDQKNIVIPDIAVELIERIVDVARYSDYVDEKSGVSARLGITALENLASTVERRMILNGEKKGKVRITDFWGIIPAMTGKLELIYEGEQEGPYVVALDIIGQGVKDVFVDFFGDPEQYHRQKIEDPFEIVKQWFSKGGTVDIPNDASQKEYESILDSVIGLEEVLEDHEDVEKDDFYFFYELILNGLSEFEIINKSIEQNTLHFEDPIANMFDDLTE